MATSTTRVVVVDDDAEIIDLVREYLGQEGFLVDEACDGETLRALMAKGVPDLVLLDLKLPGDDGLALARELRRDFPMVGIVMISGKEDVVDRVAGLEVGADDYIVKPFHLRELLARVRSVLRRRDDTAVGGTRYRTSTPRAITSSDTVSQRLYRFCGWRLDAEKRKLESSEGTNVDLTSGEFDLLVALVLHPNQALTRDQLLDYVSGTTADVYDRSVDVQIGRLRRKIERDPKRPALIKTIRNIGYMLNSDVAVSDN